MADLQLRRFADRLGRKAEHANGPDDVLDLLLAAVGEGQRQLVAHLAAGDVRNAQASRLANRFQPRGDIHAVAEQVIAVDDDVADVDADPEHDAFVVRNAAIAFQHSVLNGDGAGDCIDHALKFDQQAVAGGLDDASAATGDGRIDDLPTHGLEGTQRANFIGAHQAAVADNVRGQNRRKFSVDALVRLQSRAFGGSLPGKARPSRPKPHARNSAADTPYPRQ